MAPRPLAGAVANDWPAVHAIRGHLQAHRPEAITTDPLSSSGALVCLLHPLLNLLAFLAHRSSHHILPSPAVPSLDAGTAPSPWHAHHVPPPHVHRRARTIRHCNLSSSCSLRPDLSLCPLHVLPRFPRLLSAPHSCSPDRCPCFSSCVSRLSLSSSRAMFSPPEPRICPSFDCSHICTLCVNTPFTGRWLSRAL